MGAQYIACNLIVNHPLTTVKAAFNLGSETYQGKSFFSHLQEGFIKGVGASFPLFWSI